MIYTQLIFLCSLLDASLTDFGLREHFITEANPLAWHLYEISPVLFYGWKLLLPLLLIFLYPKVLKRKSIRMGIKMTCYLFVVLMLYHGFWLTEVYLS